mmetsp:Transcript_40994/g.103883  ORF Transcript_40994/g.103883 Transcript_40994/m.103883 type:complete len:282 (-) Transcript_40994:272-1117(-)
MHCLLRRSARLSCAHRLRLRVRRTRLGHPLLLPRAPRGEDHAMRRLRLAPCSLRRQLRLACRPLSCLSFSTRRDASVVCGPARLVGGGLSALCRRHVGRCGRRHLRCSVRLVRQRRRQGLRLPSGGHSTLALQPDRAEQCPKVGRNCCGAVNRLQGRQRVASLVQLAIDRRVRRPRLRRRHLGHRTHCCGRPNRCVLPQLRIPHRCFNAAPGSRNLPRLINVYLSRQSLPWCNHHERNGRRAAASWRRLVRHPRHQLALQPWLAGSLAKLERCRNQVRTRR